MSVPNMNGTGNKGLKFPYEFNDNFKCSSVDENHFATLDKKIPSLFFVSINVQGLISKFEKLSSFLFSLSDKFKLPDVVCIQETWLKNDIEAPILPNYHPFIHNCRANSRGGGVGFYVRESLSYTTNSAYSTFVERIYESISIDILFQNKRTTLINLYRPPMCPNLTEAQSFDVFLSNLNKVIDVSRSNTFCFMDSNINLSNKNSEADKFCDLWSTYGFSNLINTCTRITKTSSSLIDQIFTNNQQMCGLSGVITSDISDHLPLFSYIPLTGRIENPSSTYKRFFTSFNINLFKDRLADIAWASVLNDNNVMTAYATFIEIWDALFQIAFPLKKILVNRNRFKINEFFTRGLIISRNTKNALFKEFLSKRSNSTELAYKNYRNCYNKCVRTAKKIYFEHKIDNNCDPKSSWKVLLESTGKPNVKKSHIDGLSINGNVSKDNLDIANHFNEYFSTIAESTIRKIPPTSKSHRDFPFKNVSTSFEFRKVDCNSVSDIIKGFQSKNSLDITGFSTNLLKSCAELILRPLTHLINLSLSQGIFPGDLTISRTIPIFKQGCRKDASNYRPISLLPTLSKVFEKAVYNQLYSYLTMNNILSKKQFGFQPEISTQHALMQILNYISESFNENKFVVACLLDLSKAFDLINHDKLIDKLSNIGLSGISLKWFRSYLSDRKMYTFVNGTLSSTYSKLNRSVPQGSILGPLLFLIFINDMPLATDLDCFLYADDNTALTSGSEIEVVGPFVNRELSKIGEWLRANELAVNASKTKIIIFSNKKIISNFQFYFDQNDRENITANPNLITPLERISNQSDIPSVKLLGVYLDEFLTFDSHVDKICKKINSALYYLNSVKKFLSIKALTKLYYSLIHPHLVYCLSVYSFTNARNRKRLINKQKQCIRIISKSKYNAHSEPLFFQLQILPFEDLITHHKLMFMHAIAHSYSAVTFPQFSLNFQANTHRFNLRDDNNFYIPRTNISIVQKMPMIDFPNTWNNLDHSLKEITQKSLFKKSVKSELLEKYRNFSCTSTFCFSCMNLT